MKKKLLLALLCATMLASLAFAVMPAAAAEESKTTWSAVSGVYNGVTYNNPGNDFWLGTDADGNLFFETESANPYAALPQKEYYVDGFKIDFKIAPLNGASFNEGQAYYVGLGTTEMGILNALKLVYKNGAFELYAIAAGHNPDNGGVALANADGTIRIEAGETISYQLKADSAQENLDVYVNGYKTFTSANYPCFYASAAHVYYNRDGAYKGKIFVYNGQYNDGVATVGNRITFLGIQDGEYNRAETKVSAAATIVDNAWWSYENVLYKPNNEFFVGRNNKNALFYETHPSTGYGFIAASNSLYYADGFKTVVQFDEANGGAFVDGTYFLIGLSNVPNGMPMVSLRFIYSTANGFQVVYYTAGLGAEANVVTAEGTQLYVQKGEKITIEFKADSAQENLGIYVNGVLGHTTGRYPAHENTDYTLPQNGLGQYVGYLSLDNNYWLGGNYATGNRVTFWELPEKIAGKGVAPAVSELNGTFDSSLVYFETLKIWSGLNGGNFESNEFGTVNYSNPSRDFWIGQSETGKLVYESEGDGAFNAYSDLKFNVDGFKMTFMVQNKTALTVGSKMIIGLSNKKQGMTMAAIELKWTGKYFEMRYLSAACAHYDGNELSTYGNIGHLWLGQEITIEYKANTNGGLDIVVNGETAFTTVYYPSFQGLADYTFPKDENDNYYGYLTVHNGTISSTAVVASRLTFTELTSTQSSGGGEEPEEPIVPEDPKETAPEGLDTTIDESVTLTTYEGAVGAYETEKYGEISFKNASATKFASGVDANGNLIIQSVDTSNYCYATATKAYVDGFKMSFMIQTIGDVTLPNNYTIQIGLSNTVQGQTMAAIELKWTGKYFEMKYSSAGIVNYDGNELSTYSDEITHLWLGQTMTFEYKANANGGLDIYVNGIYTFTTSYYPSYQGLADYTFPKDEDGKYYGYFSIHDGAYPNSTSVEHRITFSELTLEYTAEDSDYEYEAIEEIAESAQEFTFVYGEASNKFEGVNYSSNLGNNYVVGRDVNENLYYQSTGQQPYVALSDKKVYADGMKYSFMVQKIGEAEIADKSYFLIGISQNANGVPMVSVYLVWNARKGAFELYYRAAGLTNGDGGRFNTYHDDLHNVHLGERVTIQFRENENGTLAVYMNDIYLFSTSTYPSFPGAAQFTLPEDDYGYYGYLAVLCNAGLPMVENDCDFRLTFFDLVSTGFASGTESIYDADNELTYSSGTTIGNIQEDFSYATLTSGVGKDNVRYASGSAGAFSFRYTDVAILNAVGFAFNAVHASSKDVPAYSFLFVDFTDAQNFVEVKLVKASDTTATVYVDGVELDVVAFDWANVNATSILNVGLFINADNVILQLGTSTFVLSQDVFEKITSFAQDADGNVKGYVEIQNHVGNSQIVIADFVTDGTAVQKKVAKNITTLISNVDVAFGEQFVNTYETVEVEFYDGSTESWEVEWDESAINTSFAAPYTITGRFVDISSDYYFSEDIKAMLKFVVNVGYAEGFYKYGTTEYDSESGSIWVTCGGGSNEFLYKDNGDGTYTIVSDGYKNGQFMPATTTYRDIDGYTINYTQTLLKGNSSLLIFSMFSQPKHPVQYGTPVIGLGIYVNESGAISVTFFTGSQVEAYLKDAQGNVVRQLETGAFDGISIRTEIIEGDVRYVKFYMTIAGTEYELVNADGSEFTGTSTNLVNFTNDRTYICLWNEVGYSSYTFREEYTSYVVDYTKPADTIVDFGSEHGLPTEIALTLNNGTTVQGTINWVGEYNKEVAGTYKLEGIISCDDVIGNGETIFDGIESKIEVSVTVKEQVKIIKDFTKIEDITINLGDEYTDKLPSTFTVSVYSEYYDTTTEEEINVVWTGSVNVLIAGTYTLVATPVGTYQFEEGIEENLTVNVIVEGSVDTDEPIEIEGCVAGIGNLSFISLALLGFATVVNKKRKN